MDESQKYQAEKKKPDTNYIYYRRSFICNSKKDKSRGLVKVMGYTPGKSTRVPFLGSINILYID